MAASLCVPAQQLAALQINEVEPGTGGTGYRFELRVGRILILIVEGMLNVEVGIRASENKRSHSSHTTSNSALAKADLLRSWHGPPRSPRQTGSICQKGGAAGQDRSECPTRLNRKMLCSSDREKWVVYRTGCQPSCECAPFFCDLAPSSSWNVQIPPWRDRCDSRL